MAADLASRKRKVAPHSANLSKKKHPQKVQKTGTAKLTKVSDSKETRKAPSKDRQDDFTGFDEADDEEIDDQTAALLKGFESSDSEVEEAKENEDASEIAVSSLPSVPLATGKAIATASEDKESGVIYVGRVPHGFFEHQMRAYFSQFGDISRLRLSRNRKTGASKHYGFIEFTSGEVARIVADTMDNYLLFGHLLKVKYLNREDVHADLFKGANSRFKKIPWNRLDRMKVATTDRAGWTGRVKKEEKRRLAKAEKLKALGYEFEMPALAAVEDVPVQNAVAEEVAVESPAIEAAPDQGNFAALTENTQSADPVAALVK